MTNAELGALLLSIVTLLAMAHGGGYVMERFRLPRVAGEILGGVLVGPSILGQISPTAHQALFAAFPDQGRMLSAIYWVGLIMLMFVSGFRLHKNPSPDDRRIIAVLAIAALVAPFAIGMATPDVIDISGYRGPAASDATFRLIFAIAFAVTSIPVISKIFIDLGVMNTRFAAVVLATATIEDIVLWVALAITTSLAVGEALDFWRLTRVVTATLMFLVVALALGPAILSWASRQRFNLLLKASRLGYVLLVCFVFAVIANMLDVNVVFGALTAGIVVAKLPSADFQAVRDRISDVSMGVMTPLYFAIVGVKLNLHQALDLWLIAVFFLASSAVKIACVTTGALAAGRSRNASLSFGMAMNARGGPGIVLGSIAYEFGIIDARLFVALVLTAVLTSVLAGMWLRAVIDRRHLDLL